MLHRAAPDSHRQLCQPQREQLSYLRKDNTFKAEELWHALTNSTFKCALMSFTLDKMAWNHMYHKTMYFCHNLPAFIPK